MIKSFKYFYILFALLVCNNAAARDASSFMNDWGVPAEFPMCQNSDTFNALIGPEREVCKGESATEGGGGQRAKSTCSVQGSKYVYGISMMVARIVNSHGAYFCPTVIGGDKKGGWDWGNISWNKPYTTRYYESPEINNSDCFWVCKSGYHGNECAQTSYDGCNFNQLKRENYDGAEKYSLANASQDIETDVAMFHAGVKDRCGRKSKSPFEHDVILVISDWLENGHGVYAQPFVVHPDYYGNHYSSGPGYIKAYEISEPILLCRSGYVSNNAGDSCVPLDSEACALEEARSTGTTCPTFTNDKFNDTTMEWYYADSCPNNYNYTGGFAFRCTDPDYGFKSATELFCIECPEDKRNGISEDGVCIKCETGQIFDSSVKGNCVTATALDKDRMRFGPHQSASTPLTQQCWTMADTDEYADCVFNTENRANRSLMEKYK